MTRKQANKEVRNLVKKYVSNYIKENNDFLNWEMFGLAIVKHEIEQAYKMYWVNCSNGQFRVMTHDNKILSV